MTAREYIELSTSVEFARKHVISFLRTFLSKPEIKSAFNNNEWNYVIKCLKDEFRTLDFRYGIALSTLMDTCSKANISILPDLTDVPAYFFYDNSNLKEVNISKRIKVIYHHSFTGVKNLEKIVYEGTAEEWDAIKKHQPWYFNPSKNDVLLKCMGDNSTWRLSWRGER